MSKPKRRIVRAIVRLVVTADTAEGRRMAIESFRQTVQQLRCVGVHVTAGSYRYTVDQVMSKLRAKPPESVEAMLRRLVPVGTILEIQKLPGRRGYRVRNYAFGARRCDLDGRTLKAALRAALKGTKP